MSVVKCFFSNSEYKPKQGRLFRLLFKVAGLVVGGALAFSANLLIPSYEIFAGLNVTGGAIAVLVGWCCWRIVQYPPVADFLIEVQVESQRVSWSSWSSVKRTTTVVLVAMAILSVYLLLCDVLIQLVLRSLHILNV